MLKTNETALIIAVHPAYFRVLVDNEWQVLTAAIPVEGEPCPVCHRKVPKSRKKRG